MRSTWMTGSAGSRAARTSRATCCSRASRLSLRLVEHLADGIDDRGGLFELDVFGAVAREYLLGVGGQVEPTRLRQCDVVLVLEVREARRTTPDGTDRVVARRDDADRAGAQRALVLLQVELVAGHLFHLRNVGVVHRDLGLCEL